MKKRIIISVVFLAISFFILRSVLLYIINEAILDFCSITYRLTLVFICFFFIRFQFK